MTDCLLGPNSTRNLFFLTLCSSHDTMMPDAEQIRNNGDQKLLSPNLKIIVHRFFKSRKAHQWSCVRLRRRRPVIASDLTLAFRLINLIITFVFTSLHGIQNYISRKTKFKYEKPIHRISLFFLTMQNGYSNSAAVGDN